MNKNYGSSKALSEGVNTEYQQNTTGLVVFYIFLLCCVFKLPFAQFPVCTLTGFVTVSPLSTRPKSFAKAFTKWLRQSARKCPHPKSRTSYTITRKTNNTLSLILSKTLMQLMGWPNSSGYAIRALLRARITVVVDLLVLIVYCLH